MRSLTALIDGDLLIYRTAFSAENSIQWDADMYTVQANLKQAQDDFEDMVEMLLRHTGCTKPVICISRPTQENFRLAAWPTYKAPRENQGRRSGKPLLYKAMRDWCRTKWNAVEKPTMEADDVMGIMATRHSDYRRVICSIDKDMRTIPGLHFDWRTPQVGVFMVTTREARHNFYTQVLTGDSTDNYPGCPGVGPKRAAIVLEGCETQGEYWDAVVATYAKKGLEEHDAIKQAQCARILRACDYDFETKAIRLWTPLRGE